MLPLNCWTWHMKLLSLLYPAKICFIKAFNLVLCWSILPISCWYILSLSKVDGQDSDTGMKAYLRNIQYNGVGGFNMKGQSKGQKTFNHQSKVSDWELFALIDCPWMFKLPKQVTYSDSAMHFPPNLEIKLPYCSNITPLNSFQHNFVQSLPLEWNEHETAWHCTRVKLIWHCIGVKWTWNSETITGPVVFKVHLGGV